MAEDRADGVTLAARSAGADRLVGVWLVLAAALLAAGLFLPAVTVRKLFVLSREYSLSEAVFAFLDAGEVFLFAVTFAFTIAFPVAKVAVCLALWFVVRGGSASAARLVRILAGLSKWSMLDVFIIALVVLVVDGQLLSSADVHAGVIAFTAAVVLSTYAVRRISVLLADGTEEKQ
jgi:paraquat-inducible protein A